MKQSLNSNKSNVTKIAFWILVALCAILIVGLICYFTATYFFKQQSNKGYIQFAPGIYLDFKDKTIDYTENKKQFDLLYYKEKNFENVVKFNTENEKAYPDKSYYIISPQFKSGINESNEGASFYARCKVVYTDQDNNELPAATLDYIFSKDFPENQQGKLLEFADSWKIGNDGFYYYVGNNNAADGVDATNIQVISYSEDAEYIKIFKTQTENGHDYAEIKFANQTLESYGELTPPISQIKIVLKMEFVEANLSTLSEWLTPAP